MIIVKTMKVPQNIHARPCAEKKKSPLGLGGAPSGVLDLGRIAWMPEIHGESGGQLSADDSIGISTRISTHPQ